MERNRVLVWLILLILFSYFSVVQASSEGPEAAANAQCAKYSAEDCKSKGLSEKLQTKNLIFNCDWHEEGDRCIATNVTLSPEAERQQLIDLLLLSTYFLIPLVFYGYFYFRKNISKEKLNTKKFIISSLTIFVIQVVSNFLFFTVLSMPPFLRQDFIARVLISVPLLIILVGFAIFWSLRYFIKIEKKNAYFLAAVISILSNFYPFLVFVLMLIEQIYIGLI